MAQLVAHPHGCSHNVATIHLFLPGLEREDQTRGVRLGSTGLSVHPYRRSYTVIHFYCSRIVMHWIIFEVSGLDFSSHLLYCEIWCDLYLQNKTCIFYWRSIAITGFLWITESHKDWARWGVPPSFPSWATQCFERAAGWSGCPTMSLKPRVQHLRRSYGNQRGQDTVMESLLPTKDPSKSGHHPPCHSCWSECARPFLPAWVVVLG